MIYLDNAATTFPKPLCMVREMEQCILKYCGNPGRSGHSMSLKTGEGVYQARKEAAGLFHIEDSSRIVFTYNATDSLNTAIKGVLGSGDHAITTAMEHNSVLRPLKALEREGVGATIVRCTKKGYVHPQMIEKEIRENTKLIVCTHASNVTGSIQPIAEIGRIARERGILFLVDSSQSAGCIPIDVKGMNIDMMALPGHKGLLGPLGTGVLYIRPGIAPRMLKEGGTGTNSRDLLQPAEFPEGYESGTVNAPGIIGLGESIRFIKKIGIDKIRIHEENLVNRLETHICNINELPGCKGNIITYGPSMSEKNSKGKRPENLWGKTGMICLNIKDKDCEEVSSQLNQYQIAVRSGFHCAGIAHKTIGTVEIGAVRISVGPFNTIKEMDYTAEALHRIARGR